MVSDFMLSFIITGSEAIVSRVLICLIAGFVNVFKRFLFSLLNWSLPSWALAGSDRQCSMFTGQFISLKDIRFV